MPWPEYRAPCNPQRDPPPALAVLWVLCLPKVSLLLYFCPFLKPQYAHFLPSPNVPTSPRLPSAHTVQGALARLCDINS